MKEVRMTRREILNPWLAGCHQMKLTSRNAQFVTSKRFALNEVRK